MVSFPDPHNTSTNHFQHRTDTGSDLGLTRLDRVHLKSGNNNSTLVLAWCFPCLVPFGPHKEGITCFKVSTWNATVSELNSLPFSDLQRPWSNFKNIYVLPYICFLSLVELEHGLAEVMLFPSLTPMAVTAPHYRASF